MNEVAKLCIRGSGFTLITDRSIRLFCIKMKLQFIILTCVTLAMSGCEKTSSDPAMILVDTYAPEKSTGTYPAGSFDSSPVNIYIDDKLVGTTPVTFKKSDLTAMNLPEVERIDTADGFWGTWDLGDGSSLKIRFKDSKEKPRRLDFRSVVDGELKAKKFRGFTKGINSEGTHVILIEFPDLKAEHGGGLPTTRSESK